MNRPTLFVLIALNALLTAILAMEWVANTETLTTQIQTQNNNSEVEESLSELDLTATSEDSYSDLVERPLFIKARKPVNEPAPEITPVAAVKKIETFDWELTGVFATPKGVTAFFSRTNAKVPKDNYRKHKISDELEGWKLIEIHADNVVLTQVGETKILPLRKAKPKSLPPPKTDATKPQQTTPVPAKTIQQQGTTLQNLQTTDTIQNNVEPQADESVEAVQQ